MIKNSIFTISLLVICFIINIEVESSGELGTIECVEGKWKVDTRLMALIMTCPLPLDGNAQSISKMAKCTMNKLGVYDGEKLSDDFMETVCSIFGDNDVRERCVSHGGICSMISGLQSNWETTWPVFLTCFVPWAMTLCNI